MKKLKIRKLILVYCLLNFSFLIGCAQPVLESGQCIESRTVVKKFYSFHIGNDMNPSKEYIEKREEYLSSDLLKQLSSETNSEIDYFTQTDDYPKAFRAGGCENASKEMTKFEILLFWRNDEKNIQREIEVEVVRENDKWLVNMVRPKE